MSEVSAFDFKNILCPICKSSEFKFMGWRGGEAHHSGAGEKTAIVRCRKCSHQYPNPMPFPKLNLEEVYLNAEDYFRGHDVEHKKKVGLDLIGQFEKKIGRKGKYLDVGCGIGEFLWAATESGWEVEGIDPSKEFIEIGNQILKVEGQVTTLEEAKFPDNYFDAVTLSGIIEHLYTPLETLREVFRVIRPGGWLWLDAPNEDGLYMKFGNLYMKTLRKDWVVTMAPTFPPYHVQGFNPKSLKRLISEVGFDSEEIEISGRIDAQTGKQTVRKKVETDVARFINSFGKIIGRGMYMSVWVRKP